MAFSAKHNNTGFYFYSKDISTNTWAIYVQKKFEVIFHQSSIGIQIAKHFRKLKHLKAQIYSPQTLMHIIHLKSRVNNPLYPIQGCHWRKIANFPDFSLTFQ